MPECGRTCHIHACMGFFCDSELKLEDQENCQEERGVCVKYLVIVPSVIEGHIHSVERLNIDFSVARTLEHLLIGKGAVAEVSDAYICSVLSYLLFPRLSSSDLCYICCFSKLYFRVVLMCVWSIQQMCLHMYLQS